jgi:hypothetical protein
MLISAGQGGPSVRGTSNGGLEKRAEWRRKDGTISRQVRYEGQARDLMDIQAQTLEAADTRLGWVVRGQIGCLKVSSAIAAGTHLLPTPVPIPYGAKYEPQIRTKVWLTASSAQVQIFAVEVSADGGNSYWDPLNPPGPWPH